MAYGRVTARTLKFIGFTVHSINVDVLHNVLVTTTASRFCDIQIKLCDLNVVWIVAGCEIKRMEETIACLDRLLPDEIVRRMTVVAGGGGAVTRLHPRIMLGAHGVAIGAR